MLVVDVDETPAPFANQILKAGVDLSIEKTFLERFSNCVFNVAGTGFVGKPA